MGGVIVTEPGSVLNGPVIDGADDIALHIKASGVKVRGAVITSCGGSAIHIDGGLSDVTIDSPDIADCGLADGLNPTWQGAGIYTGPVSGLLVRGGQVRRSRGHAAVFLVDPDTTIVTGVDIGDTFYRGIQVHGPATRTLLHGNTICGTGAINTTGSATACNGIFLGGATLDPADLVVNANMVSRTGENGIEGTGLIRANIVTDTGYFPHLDGPSKEGVYAISRTRVLENLIVRPFDRGVYCFGAFSDVEITRNTIVDATKAIELHAHAGVGERVEVFDNVPIRCGERAVVGASAGGSFSQVAVQFEDESRRHYNT